MITRRQMLRGTLALGGAALFAPHLLGATVIPKDRWFTERLGWSIGPQLWSFNRFPFNEAIAMTIACGANRIEIFGGQRFSREENLNFTVGTDLLNPANRDNLNRVKDLLKENGVAPHAFGVVGGSRADFEFAAEFNIPLLNMSPQLRRMDEVSALAEEYRINVGLHNHPYPNAHWSPAAVLRILRDTSMRVGACADTTHWVRSGLDPVECIQKLRGRITGWHICDIDENGTDVPLGQGVGQVDAMLREFATHEFTGVMPFSIEFEANWYNNQEDVAECIRYFDAVARDIVTAR